MVTTSVRHPIELLEAFEHNTEPTTKITTNTNKRQLKNTITTIKTKMERMQLIFQTSLNIHDIKNEDRTSFEKEFRATRRAICLSYLDKNFREKYEDEFEDVKGSSDFYTLLNQIIGEVNPEEEAREARSKIREISRRVEENETFARFYTRLEKLATTASKGNDTLKTHYLDEAFHANLTPDLRRYLLDQGKSKVSSKAIADYLDTMKKNVKIVEIKAVNAEETLLREQVTALAHQFTNLPQLLENSIGSSLKSMIDAKIENMRREIADINKIKPRNGSENKQEPIYEQRNAINTTSTFTRQRGIESADQRPLRQLERHQDGSPITCSACGLKGHSKKNCRGTVVCRNCGQRGHIAAICRMSKN
jgi:hypothetical protein